MPASWVECGERPEHGQDANQTRRDIDSVIPREDAPVAGVASTSVPSGNATGPRRLRLAVLLSGTGRTLENLLRAIDRGDLPAGVEIVGSSVPDVRGVQIAAGAGIPAFVLRRRDFASDETYSEALFARISPYEPDLVLLSGFLRRLVIPANLDGRLLNIHPGLLPEGPAGRGFYGERVHAAVLASGAAETGATVHVVDNEYDAGPVVLRVAVPVLAGDTAETLGARVFAAECDLYPRAILHYVAAHPELFMVRGGDHNAG